MRSIIRHIWLWMLVIGSGLMTVSCSSSDSDSDTEEPQATYLTIYVYSPERPILMRGDVGYVDPGTDEGTVHRLQIWVFEHQSGNLVGYHSTATTAALNTSQGDIYRIAVNDDFASQKPDVDVYVLANVTADNCGLSFDQHTTRDQLDAAQLDGSHFGLTSLTKTVPADGLPMSGILLNQDVVGDAPVLRIGSLSNIATVQLTRVVSKMRFVFSNIKLTESPESYKKLSITGITLDENTMRTAGYLFSRSSLDGLGIKNSEVSLILSSDAIVTEEVATNENPTEYIYNDEEAQTYENKINTAVNAGKLTQVGPFYLHESDMQVKGKIAYKIDETEKTPIVFQMERAGDFLRNHTWIVYAYYLGGSFLELSSIYVKDWRTKDDLNYEIYNW